MGESSSWRSLHVPDSLPHLLVKYHLDEAGYAIYISDLSRIWVERLDRAAIADRASSTGCTIEPGEDDQFQILLEKIKTSLNGDDATSLSLYSRSDGQRLDVIVTAPLPSPLPDFKWTAHLSRSTEDFVGSELVAPLMLEAHRLHGQIRSLIDEIQAKDRIISKITDRLETSGNDLATVFPGVSSVKVSRKKAQRPQLAKHVKGLGDFQESEWRARLPFDQSSQELTNDVIDSIFTHGPGIKNIKTTTESRDAWWQRLSDDRLPVRSRETPAEPRESLVASDAGTQESAPTESVKLAMSETDFETQSTPPHFRRREGELEDNGCDHAHLPPDNKSTNDESTEDEDEGDLDAPARAVSPSPVGAAAPVSVPRTPRKLGKLGGSNQKPGQDTLKQSDTAQTQPELTVKKKMGTLGGMEKRAYTEDDHAAEIHGKAESRPRSRLGAFGGKPNMPSVDMDEASSNPEAPESRSKLGTIGGKRMSRTTASSNTVQPQPDTSNTKTGKTEEVSEEKSQERANRKRDQLKRELEEKAKAPVKKKRRF